MLEIEKKFCSSEESVALLFKIYVIYYTTGSQLTDSRLSSICIIQSFDYSICILTIRIHHDMDSNSSYDLIIVYQKI